MFAAQLQLSKQTMLMSFVRKPAQRWYRKHWLFTIDWLVVRRYFVFPKSIDYIERFYRTGEALAAGDVSARRNVNTIFTCLGAGILYSFAHYWFPALGDYSLSGFFFKPLKPSLYLNYTLIQLTAISAFQACYITLFKTRAKFMLLEMIDDSVHFLKPSSASRMRPKFMFLYNLTEICGELPLSKFTCS